MDYISRHLKAASPLLAHRGGVKPPRYANTVMETCSEPWEVSCKTSFSIGQMLCKDVRSLRNWFKAKPVTARTRFELGTLSCLCQPWSASPGLKNFPNALAQRPQAHLIYQEPLTSTPIRLSTLMCHSVDKINFFRIPDPFLPSDN